MACSGTALQSLRDLGRLTYRRFLELFRQTVGLGRVISPSQGLYLHRTGQHNTEKRIYALSGIRTHDPSNQPAKTHASDRTATVTGTALLYISKYYNYSFISVSSLYGFKHLKKCLVCRQLISSAVFRLSHDTWVGIQGSATGNLWPCHNLGSRYNRRICFWIWASLKQGSRYNRIICFWFWVSLKQGCPN
jgi:hypothetical protein